MTSQILQSALDARQAWFFSFSTQMGSYRNLPTILAQFKAEHEHCQVMIQQVQLITLI